MPSPIGRARDVLEPVSRAANGTWDLSARAKYTAFRRVETGGRVVQRPAGTPPGNHHFNRRALGGHVPGRAGAGPAGRGARPGAPASRPKRRAISPRPWPKSPSRHPSSPRARPRQLILPDRWPRPQSNCRKPPGPSARPMNLIRKVASQTRLLSINAGRGGCQGRRAWRGFRRGGRRGPEPGRPVHGSGQQGGGLSFVHRCGRRTTGGGRGRRKKTRAGCTGCSGTSHPRPFGRMMTWRPYRPISRK